MDREDIVWSDLPGRENGGTPNFAGIIALAEACKILRETGFEHILDHEQALLRRASETLKAVPGIRLLHDFIANPADVLPVFSFHLPGFSHGLVGAYLGFEKGIGVRTGPLCQFSLVRKFLDIPANAYSSMKTEAEKGDVSNIFGLVRASCGIGNRPNDLTVLADALKELVAGGPKAQYKRDSRGNYLPEGWTGPGSEIFTA
jgi:selenocysteine lyase/cysteine desulfurase